MRKTKKRGGFFLCLGINMLLNLEWSIPAWILLALYCWLGISLWWFVGAMVLWVLRVMAGMWFMGWVSSCGNEKEPPKPNKNPYSKTNNNFIKE